jgi:hypothetical protein
MVWKYRFQCDGDRSDCRCDSLAHFLTIAPPRLRRNGLSDS